MAADYKKRIGSRIREARLAIKRADGKSLTQRELARMLPGKVDGPSISRWERGIVKPNDSMLEAIATTLKRELAWFYGPEGPPAEQEETREDALLRGMADLRAQMKEVLRRLPPADEPPPGDSPPEADDPPRAA